MTKPFKPFKIFIAYPGDVSGVAEAIYDSFNDSSKDFLAIAHMQLYDIFKWDRALPPMSIKKGQELQDNINQFAGDNVHRLIVVFGKRLGKKTVEEYKRFRDVYEKLSTDCDLHVFFADAFSTEIGEISNELKEWKKAERINFSSTDFKKRDIRIVKEYAEDEKFGISPQGDIYKFLKSYANKDAEKLIDK
jgi:hypothetical protein